MAAASGSMHNGSQRRFEIQRPEEYCVFGHWCWNTSKVHHPADVAETCVVSSFESTFICFVLKCMKFVCSSDPSELFAIPNTNLEFASLCLRNALALVEHIENDFNLSAAKPETSSKLHQTTEKTQCNPSKALTYNTFQKLKYAVLAAYSYVQITLGEYLFALKFAQELLQMPNLPDPYA